MLACRVVVLSQQQRSEVKQNTQRHRATLLGCMYEGICQHDGNNTGFGCIFPAHTIVSKAQLRAKHCQQPMSLGLTFHHRHGTRSASSQHVRACRQQSVASAACSMQDHCPGSASSLHVPICDAYKTYSYAKFHILMSQLITTVLYQLIFHCSTHSS